LFNVFYFTKILAVCPYQIQQRFFLEGKHQKVNTGCLHMPSMGVTLVE